MMSFGQKAILGGQSLLFNSKNRFMMAAAANSNPTRMFSSQALDPTALRIPKLQL